MFKSLFLKCVNIQVYPNPPYFFSIILIKTSCDNKDGHLGFPCATEGKELPSCMFDLDHIDGDYYHNVAENLQTLDKCCHAEKSKREGDCKRQDRYA